MCNTVYKFTKKIDKMIYILPVFLIAAVVTCDVSKPTVVLDSGLLALFTEKATTCQIESGAEPAALSKIFPLQLEESEENGKFLLCLARELKFKDANDSLDIDKFMDTFKETMKSQDTNAVRKVLEECKKESGKNLYYTVFKLAKCYYDKSPFRIILL